LNFNNRRGRRTTQYDLERVWADRILCEGGKLGVLGLRCRGRERGKEREPVLRKANCSEEERKKKETNTNVPRYFHNSGLKKKGPAASTLSAARGKGGEGKKKKKEKDYHPGPLLDIKSIVPEQLYDLSKKGVQVFKAKELLHLSRRRGGKKGRAQVVALASQIGGGERRGDTEGLVPKGSR